ncbi:hypothetical protein AVEN_103189-1 [Araneus ventricosus]|uniref:Uncharacterized protein n=1 Tax=Araneus ventricosus TaxID=182803 RepID=A0A4Y2FYH5_ARAVE|nr:hypothetical protein AVEN_103189-1 [Araneus ventricosus]
MCKLSLQHCPKKKYNYEKVRQVFDECPRLSLVKVRRSKNYNQCQHCLHLQLIAIIYFYYFELTEVLLTKSLICFLVIISRRNKPHLFCFISLTVKIPGQLFDGPLQARKGRGPQAPGGRTCHTAWLTESQV